MGARALGVICSGIARVLLILGMPDKLAQIQGAGGTWRWQVKPDTSSSSPFSLRSFVHLLMCVCTRVLVSANAARKRVEEGGEGDRPGLGVAIRWGICRCRRCHSWLRCRCVRGREGGTLRLILVEGAMERGEERALTTTPYRTSRCAGSSECGNVTTAIMSY